MMNDVHSWIKRSFKSTNVGFDMDVPVYECGKEMEVDIMESYGFRPPLYHNSSEDINQFRVVM